MSASQGIQPVQLPLGIRLNDEARFENYLITSSNQALVDELLEQPSLLYIRGNPGSGRSHLLQALCHQRSQLGEASLYLPLGQRDQLSPEILQGLDSMALVCLDDVDRIAGDRAWEAALFTAFNVMRVTQKSSTQLVIAGSVPPGELEIQLADLQSRLQLAPVYQLHELDDEEKKQLLQLRARGRGMNLSPVVADYVVARAERSLAAIMAVLDKLDASSLAHQRPITVPLVKQTMQW